MVRESGERIRFQTFVVCAVLCMTIIIFWEKMESNLQKTHFTAKFYSKVHSFSFEDFKSSFNRPETLEKYAAIAKRIPGTVRIGYSPTATFDEPLPGPINSTEVKLPDNSTFHLSQNPIMSSRPFRFKQLQRNYNNGTSDAKLKKYHFTRFGFSIHNCKSHLFKTSGSKPSFLVAGVHKGGSTAFFAYLMQHDRISPPNCKETNFFTDENEYLKGMSSYLRHFPNLSRPGSRHMITGEATPNYIRHPFAPSRIQKEMPDIKILILLRNPVHRFISQFIGFNGRKENTTCNKFLERELLSWQKCEESLAVGKGENSSSFTSSLKNSTSEDIILQKRICALKNYDLALSRGMYAYQIERWLKFFPPENIRIIQSEKLNNSTDSVMQETVRFLGLRNYSPEETKGFSQTFTGSNHLSITSQTDCEVHTLQRYYADHNKLLYKLLQKHWPETAKTWVYW